MKLLYVTQNENIITISYLDSNKQIKQKTFSKNKFLNIEEDFEKMLYKNEMTLEEFLQEYDTVKNLEKQLNNIFNTNITINEITGDTDNSLVGNILENPTLQNIFRIDDKNMKEAFNIFMKKLNNNVDLFVRQQLLKFIEYLNRSNKSKLTLSKNGNLLLYKAVEQVNNNVFEPYHKGIGGYVNGEYSKQLHQKIGDVVTMKRSDVEANPERPCSQGLHCGTWEYVKSFGSKDSIILLCEVNPEDVVSVPYDCDSQKIRCSKYKIIKQVEEPIKELVY